VVRSTDSEALPAETKVFVMPAKAGIQGGRRRSRSKRLDSRLRGND